MTATWDDLKVSPSTNYARRGMSKRNCDHNEDRAEFGRKRCERRLLKDKIVDVKRWKTTNRRRRYDIGTCIESAAATTAELVTEILKQRAQRRDGE